MALFFQLADVVQPRSLEMRALVAHLQLRGYVAEHHGGRVICPVCDTVAPSHSYCTAFWLTTHGRYEYIFAAIGSKGGEAPIYSSAGFCPGWRGFGWVSPNGLFDLRIGTYAYDATRWPYLEDTL